MKTFSFLQLKTKLLQRNTFDVENKGKKSFKFLKIKRFYEYLFQK